MAATWKLGIVLVVLMAVAGAVTGYLLAPRYQVPEDSSEAYLQGRAAEYYRAIQVRDHGTMGCMYTPARQLAESERLRNMALEQAQMFSNFQPETRATFLATAESIDADSIDVELEGDWAVTTGIATTDAGGTPVPIGLGEVVWVRDSGEWWVFAMTYDELNAYGNPPDFARKILKDQAKYGVEVIPSPLDASEEETGAEGGLEGSAVDEPSAVADEPGSGDVDE
jgi:hypothetical protein